jgi:hypothetical protein
VGIVGHAVSLSLPPGFRRWIFLASSPTRRNVNRRVVAAVIDGGDVLAGALEEVGEGLAVGLVEGEEV